MTISVIKGGLLTTLQDAGRVGHAALGVGTAGPMDEVAFRLANALVGNASDATALEITLIGPHLRFDIDAVIAMTGAEFDALLNDEPLRAWRPLPVAAGCVLDCGRARRGARAYLAVAGGFMATAVLGSTATDVNARLGLFDGRPLRSGDTLSASAGMPADPMLLRSRKRASGLPALAQGSAMTSWSLDPRPWFDPDPSQPIHLLRGTHFDVLDDRSRAALFAEDFRISADSNRVGFRLDGPRLALAQPLELISEAVAFGTVQLPASGQPIALMAEHPTTGGYPRIGQITAIDLSRLAQRRPGERVRFAEIGLDDAQTRYLARERELAHLIDAIAQRLAG